MTTMSVSSSYTSSSSSLSSFSKSSFNLETITAAELEPIKLFLQTALQNKQRGQPQGYNVLVQQFRSKDDPEMLGKVVIALNSYISGILARPDIYQDLLTQIFSWNWKTEMSINMTIIQLIFHIVVTNATYLSSAFKLLVKAFIPENAVAVKDNPDTARIELLKHVHDIIAKIIQQVPTGLSELLKIVTEFFPHKRFSVYIQTEYIQQLLTLCNAFPVLQGRILDIIIEKCLEMDVEIIIEDDGEVRLQRDVEYSTSLQDDGNNHLYEDINDVFDDNVFGSGLTARKFGAAATASASSAVAGCRTQTSHGASIPTEVAELAEKLDSILSQLIDYFHDYISKYQQQPTTPLTSTTTSTNSTSSPPSSPSSPELSRFYQQLIDLFQQRLLLTHKSKYVQFIFFYVASQSAEFRHLFTKKLLDIIFNIHESILIRQSAMMYLASYLSRATFLPNDVISEVISDLLRWAAAYVLHYQAQNINLKSTMKPSSSTSSLTSAANLDIADERHPHHFYHILLQTIQQRFQQQLLTDLVFPTSSSSVDNTSSSGNRYEYDEYGRLQLVHHKVLDHELFYVIIQSICYILCFYGAEMMKAQLQSTHLLHCWNLVFSSKFEPIRYVIKSIRTEFLKLAQIVGLLDSVCWELFPLEILYVDVSQGHQQTDLPPPAPLLLYQKKGGGRKLPSSHQMTSLLSERYEILSSSMSLTSSSSKSNLYTSPNRGGLHSVSSNSNMFASLGPNTIESFFPFDPCLLMKIYYSIEKHYRPWNGVPGLDETQLYQSLLVVNGLVITATTTTTVSEVTHRNGMTSLMNKSSASINVEFQQEIFGEDIYDIDEEDDEDEDNDEEEEDDGEYYHSGSRSRNMPIKGSSTGHQHQVAMSMSYTETNYSASVTSHGDEDHEDGYSSSYSMSVTSSIPREQVMLEIIQKSKNHSNHRN